MRRREFIILLGGAAAAWPFAARAQQPGKLPTVGFFGAYTAVVQSQWTAALVQRLRELGWVEGRTIAIEYRWAEGRNERFAEIAVEFVRLKVDVIVTSGTPPVLAAKQATSVIPIVATAGDPVGTGLVASLAQPGGNITGLSSQTADVASKRFDARAAARAHAADRRADAVCSRRPGRLVSKPSFRRCSNWAGVWVAICKSTFAGVPGCRAHSPLRGRTGGARTGRHFGRRRRDCRSIAPGNTKRADRVHADARSGRCRLR